MKTTIIAFICLSHFTLFGQSIDSLILGNWNWNEKGENTVVLKRMDSFKYNASSLCVSDNDTIYCSAYGPACGNVSKGRERSLRRGTWYFDSSGLFVIKHERYHDLIEEQFEIIDSKKNKILLKRIERIEHF